MSQKFDVDSFLRDLESDEKPAQKSTSKSTSSKATVKTSNSSSLSPKSTAYQISSTYRSLSPQSTSKHNNIDQFIADLENSSSSKKDNRSGPSHSISPSPTSPAPASSSKSSTSSASSHCYKILLGAEGTPRGIYRSTSTPSACDCLHCTQCDFKVVVIRNVAWNKSAQYIDFRNANTKITSLYPMTFSRPGLLFLTFKYIIFLFFIYK